MRLIALALLLVIPLSACQGSARPASAGFGMPKVEARSSDFYLGEGEREVSDGRAIIRTMTLRVAVDEPGKASTACTDIVEQEGGFVDSSYREEGGTARLTVRVPRDRLDIAVDRIAELGKELERSVSARDVTDQVSDLSSELENKRALRERLRALYERGQTVKELLEIERELSNVQLAIDRIEGRLSRLETDVAMSTLEVTLERQRILGPLGYLFVGIGWFFKKLFVLQD